MKRSHAFLGRDGRARIVLAWLLLVAGASGQLLLVPEQHATVQAALNAAPSGAVVSLAPGLYQGNLTVMSDGVTLRSRIRHAATLRGGGGGNVLI